MTPETRDLALFLIRELDRTGAEAQRIRTMPNMAAGESGKASAYLTALAYMSGQDGARSVDEFVRILRESAAPGELGPVAVADCAHPDVDHIEFTRGSNQSGICHDCGTELQRAGPSFPWRREPVAEAADAEPMGGWEPRS